MTHANERRSRRPAGADRAGETASLGEGHEPLACRKPAKQLCRFMSMAVAGLVSPANK